MERQKQFAVAFSGRKKTSLGENETVFLELISAENKEEAIGKFILSKLSSEYYLGAFRVMLICLTP